MFKKQIFILLLLVPFINWGQQEDSFYENTYKLQTKSISYNSQIKILKSKIFSIGNITKSLLKKDSLESISIAKELDNSFNTNIFNRIIEINQLEFSLISKKNGNSFVGDFTIQEWVFENINDADKAFKYLLNFHKLKDPTYNKIPFNWKWLNKGNLIYFIDSESYKKTSKEFNSVFNKIKEVI